MSISVSLAFSRPQWDVLHRTVPSVFDLHSWIIQQVIFTSVLCGLFNILFSAAKTVSQCLCCVFSYLLCLMFSLVILSSIIITIDLKLVIH